MFSHKEFNNNKRITTYLRTHHNKNNPRAYLLGHATKKNCQIRVLFIFFNLNHYFHKKIETLTMRERKITLPLKSVETLTVRRETSREVTMRMTVMANTEETKIEKKKMKTKLRNFFLWFWILKGGKKWFWNWPFPVGG